MMTSRRPAEPPPMYSALAKTGENNRCMVCLSLCGGNSFAVSFYSEATPQAGFFPWGITRLAGEDISQLKLHFHKMFLAIILQLQHGTRLFIAVQKYFRRNFPSAQYIDARNVIDGFAMTIVELE